MAVLTRGTGGGDGGEADRCESGAQIRTTRVWRRRRRRQDSSGKRIAPEMFWTRESHSTCSGLLAIAFPPIESEKPKTRYRVTRMAKTLIPLQNLLSDRAMDRQMRKALKMR